MSSTTKAKIQSIKPRCIGVSLETYTFNTKASQGLRVATLKSPATLELQL